MTDADRLAEIEARLSAWHSFDGLTEDAYDALFKKASHRLIQKPWAEAAERLIARVRALEAQAAADSVLVEAASQYGKAEKAAVDSLFEAQPVSVTRALRMEAGVAYRRLVAALAALEGEE